MEFISELGSARLRIATFEVGETAKIGVTTSPILYKELEIKTKGKERVGISGKNEYMSRNAKFC